MANDLEIGRVVSVDTAQVTIELNPDLKALTRTTYEAIHEVGRINSYVILPVGTRRLVAMVTRVSLTEEAEIRPDRTAVALPAARRMMKATLVGTIDGHSFTPGVSLFPVLDNPVHLATASDLNLMFDVQEEDQAPPDPKKPGFCVHLGASVVFEGYPIRIDPDAFFGKHAAVLGSTGSGKSCTIASLLQSILAREEIQQTNIVILDTNGEYRTAFQIQEPDGSWRDAGKWRCLNVSSDPSETASRLVIPYWFLNAEDFVRLFRAKEGLQAPVLLRALRFARARSGGENAVASIIDALRIACNQLLAWTENDAPSQLWALPSNIDRCCGDGLRYRETFPEYVAALESVGLGTVLAKWENALKEIRRVIASTLLRNPTDGLGATRIQKIRDLLTPVLRELNQAAASQPSDVYPITADQPRFFARYDFVERALESAMREQAALGSPGRIRENCGPMVLRIRRLFEDPRFRFLFDQFPDVAHALATFLRDVLGLPRATDPRPALSSPLAGRMPFYDRQRTGSRGHHVVILDLSLLASEVLENITALIGRLILEFLQQLGEMGGENSRGSLPVVLVLEEAQNYIREPRHGEEESISRLVFERIAREGRKYGLGLVISSQRPSELSRTVLSQCSSFVVHRLQNPEDLRYFREIVPGIYGDLLNQLPALAPQTALVLGECVRVPALVRIREAQPVPRSHDPRFYEHWVANAPRAVPVEETCARWEGRDLESDAVISSEAGQEAAIGADDEGHTQVSNGRTEDSSQ